MRGNCEAHELIAPGNLPAVLELLAAEPGAWTPIAGGTEIMVAHAAGRLNVPKLVSLWGIGELRFINVTADSVAIGAGANRGRWWRAPQAGSAPLPTRAALRWAAIL
jgi:xanthine dehydrogenase iron-sulfur cluster and FAD-binding subunit A